MTAGATGGSRGSGDNVVLTLIHSPCMICVWLPRLFPLKSTLTSSWCEREKTRRSPSLASSAVCYPSDPLSPPAICSRPRRLSRAEALGRGVAVHAMLLLDTSFLVEFENELVHQEMGPARGVLRAHRSEAVAISIISLGEFAEGFTDPRAVVEFLAPFRVVALSRAIAWRTAALQSSLAQRLGDNDACIAATALAYEATLIGRERAFKRVPRLDYVPF